VRLSPEEAYTHLRRVTSLTRRQMGMAREVCAWRERLAAARDIPRKWVLSDEVVLEVCKRIPRTRERLARIRGAERLSATDANALLEAVYAGLVCPEEELPRYVRRQRPAAEVESVLDLMYAMLRVISDRSGVATQLIATRDDLQDLVSGKSGRLSEGWRAELAGKPLTRLLEGEVGLTVKNGRIELL
jgi:ribonuclease D